MTNSRLRACVMAGESWRVSFSGGRDQLPSLPSMDNECPDSEIAKFYDGRSIFITGATGFMGKVSDGESDSAAAAVAETRLHAAARRGVGGKVGE